MRFPGIGPQPIFWSSEGALELSLDVSLSLLIEDQGLVEVGLSAILEPFDSNRFMLCPWAVPFFQKLCPVSFPPVSDTAGFLGLRVQKHSTTRPPAAWNLGAAELRLSQAPLPLAPTSSHPGSCLPCCLVLSDTGPQRSSVPATSWRLSFSCDLCAPCCQVS